MRTVSRHCHCASPADAEYTVIKGHPFSRCHAHCHVTVTVHHQLMLSTLSPRDTPSAGDIMYSVTTMSVHHQLMPSTLSLRDTLSAGDMYTVSQHCHCASAWLLCSILVTFLCKLVFFNIFSRTFLICSTVFNSLSHFTCFDGLICNKIIFDTGNGNLCFHVVVFKEE